MTVSDDEYGFDDLVLDDRALAVIDATERNLTTLNAHAPITRPRSIPERQPTKWLRTIKARFPVMDDKSSTHSQPRTVLLG